MNTASIVPEVMRAADLDGGPLEFIRAHTRRGCRVDTAHLLDTASLPSVTDVVGLLNDPMLRAQAVRVVTKGESQAVRKFSSSTDYNSKVVHDSLNSLSLRRAFAGGSTLIIEDVGKWHPPVTKICNTVFNEDWLYANAGYFITRSGNGGLPFHADEEITFVFQVTGSKKWQVADYAADRLGAADVPSDARVYEFVMRPGDAACIPPMHPHRTEAIGGGDSIHLTVGVRRFKLKDFFTDLADRGLSRVPALEEEIGSIEETLVPLIGALEGASGEAWRREMAIASIRVAGGLADRGFEFIATDAPTRHGTRPSGSGDLLWCVRLGDRTLVQFSGTFAMMDDAGLAALRSAVAMREARGCTWHELAAEYDMPSAVRGFLTAAGWALGEDRKPEVVEAQR